MLACYPLEAHLSKPVTLQPNPKLKGKRYKRKGPITPVEQALIEQVVLDQPREIQPAQVTALAKALNRPVDAIKPIVEAARSQFVQNVARYVNIHLEAANGALASEDYETAAKAAQWALQSIAHEGARVVDKATGDIGSGLNIMIGLKVGGGRVDPDAAASIEAEVVKE